MHGKSSSVAVPRKPPETTSVASDMSQTPSTAATVASACSGAVATALVVTPFDVLKTRTQARAGCSSVRHIVRHEGVTALWSGLRPAILMTVPANAIYFTAYEQIRDAVAASSPQSSQDLASMLAAGGAKLLASTATAPLELMRTRMQADRALLAEGMLGGAAALVRREGVRGLFRGLGPMLCRDVPFSCTYWLVYERLRRRSVAAHPEHELSTCASFASGGAAGALATLLTMPLDVVKTRRQVDGARPPPAAASTGAAAASAGAAPALSAGRGRAAGLQAPLPSPGRGAPSSTAAMLVSIARSEGPRALLAGVGPRLAKMAPSCAIMIATFEAGKKWLPPATQRAAGAR